MRRTTDYLLSLQAKEGYWLGELESDITLESDYLFWLHAMGKADPDRIAGLANYIRRKQLAEGGWNIYEGGPSELNATVKAYFALKLAGDSARAPHLERARRCVHRLGGVERTNSYTRFYLALAGVMSWEKVPAIPPEIMLLPAWSGFSIYSFSSWTRAILVPLMILFALKPKWSVAAPNFIEELYLEKSGQLPAFQWDDRVLTWRNVFLALERVLSGHERFPWKPFRRLALARARCWLLEHLERSHGLGAIYPAMMNSTFALLALGYPSDDPLSAREREHLRALEIAEDDIIRLQPCVSPVWDTATVMVALQEAGLPANHPAMVNAARWLLQQQVLGPGDWQINNPHAEPGGWAFEFRNDFFPDVDDTTFVLLALQHVDFPEPARLRLSLQRAANWVLSMQNRDGGWGAFDRDNDSAILTRVPFADHNAMIDPSTADVTARALESLAHLGCPASHPVVQRGLEYLRREQTAEGDWYGRWGVNHVYGTSGVLRALEPLGETSRDYARRAAEWLRSVQNPDGGWGETCASYADPRLKSQGASTPSQTAWGLIGLLAAGCVSDPAVTHAVNYLLERQEPDGTWEEAAFTGTGFPSVFFLKYHLYRSHFPLYALARYLTQLRGAHRHRGVRFLPWKFPGRFGSNGNGRVR